MSDSALVLLSAGLDSSVGLALALEAGLQIRLALCFDYGQRAAAMEVSRAAALAAHFAIPLQVIELPWLGAITTTALSRTGSEPIPEVTVTQLDQIATVTLASAAQVWVPNRNGLLINIAGSFADAGGDFRQFSFTFLSKY